MNTGEVMLKYIGEFGIGFGISMVIILLGLWGFVKFMAYLEQKNNIE